MLLDLEKFRISTYGNDVDSIEHVNRIEKKCGINFPPDFLYLNISIGCVIAHGIELNIHEQLFGRTITFKDYDLSFDNFKLLPEYQNKFMAFASTESNQVFFLMGLTIENLNQIYIIDNNFGEPPIKISDNMFNFFNHDLK